MILLDTNVLSELAKRQPDPQVAAYFRRQPQSTLFTSAICEAEIHHGLAQLPPGRRRNELGSRLTAFLTAAFGQRVLAFDSAAAAVYGEIRSARSAIGRPIGLADAMIAATARAYGLAIVTRDISGFSECGVAIVNPWGEA